MKALLLLALALAGTASAAPARLDEAQVRTFLARQSHAWNGGDLPAYFATFTAGARFTDQALGTDNKIVPYGSSTVAQAQVQSRRALATGKVSETLTLDAVAFGPDGRTARVSARVVSTIAKAAAVRRVCARRIETLELTPAGLRATGQTDTIVRCRPGGIG